MKVKARIDFLWFKKGDELPDDYKEHFEHYLKCEYVEEVKESTSKSKKQVLDLNGDGKVDKEDASIAGKVMHAMRKKKK